MILINRVCFQRSDQSIRLFSDKISRRCDEQGHWQKMNITNCRRLTPKEAVEKGKQAANIPATQEVSS